MRWVTRAPVRVGPVARPWLTRRFVNPEVKFRFEPWSDAALSEDDGTPFDFPNLEIPFTPPQRTCTSEILAD